MTKDELIRLKKKIETKVHIVDAYSGSGPISLLEIEKQINTVGAVEDRKSTRLNSSHPTTSRMPSSA